MTINELIDDVFSCMHCEGTGLPFVRTREGKFYRFPPIIGAVGQAPVLFVGINPRVSESNQILHDHIVQNRSAFFELAKNRVEGVPYIARYGLESHYLLHVRVAEALFPGAPFESVAAVTELHFCASESSAGLPPDSSRCADRFFARVLRLTSPKVIFAVGAPVERALGRKFQNIRNGRIVALWAGGDAPVIPLRHPNARGPKEESWQAAIDEASKYLTQPGAACEVSIPTVITEQQSTHVRVVKKMPESFSLAACNARYEFSRLCFKADVIEPLSMDQKFCVITPVGTFAMTKRQFYATFPNVLVSESYRLRKIYHYPTLPQKALQFRIA